MNKIMTKMNGNIMLLKNIKIDITKNSIISGIEAIESDDEDFDECETSLAIIEKLNEEKALIEASHGLVLEKYTITNERLHAAEHCKELLREQLAVRFFC